MYNSGNSSKNVTGSSVVDGTLENADFADNGLSGDKIDGGIISNFQSTGIDDNATSTAITIDASENVGIGTTDPESRKLWVEGGTSTVDVVNIKKTASSGATGTYTLNVDSSSHSSNMSAAGAFRVKTYGGDALVVNGQGNVTVGVGNLVIGTSGKGIDFSAATPDGTGTTGAEILDDYEEGTWSPTITFASGTGTVVYNIRNGGYTKIGNSVFISGRVRSTDIGLLTGNVTITGLPFTAGATELPTISVAVGLGLDIPVTSGVTGYVNPSTTIIHLQAWEYSVGTTYMNHNDWTNGGSIAFSATYTT